MHIKCRVAQVLLQIAPPVVADGIHFRHMHTALQQTAAIIIECLVLADILIVCCDKATALAIHTPVAAIAAVGTQSKYF